MRHDKNVRSKNPTGIRCAQCVCRGRYDVIIRACKWTLSDNDMHSLSLTVLPPPQTFDQIVQREKVRISVRRTTLFNGPRTLEIQEDKSDNRKTITLCIAVNRYLSVVSDMELRTRSCCTSNAPRKEELRRLEHS